MRMPERHSLKIQRFITAEVAEGAEFKTVPIHACVF
jgi:hypothetical protein